MMRNACTDIQEIQEQREEDWLNSYPLDEREIACTLKESQGTDAASNFVEGWDAGYKRGLDKAKQILREEFREDDGRLEDHPARTKRIT